jgi:serine/threonine protein kinase
MPEVARTIGRYELLRPIGRGGMAVVHLARQTDLQRLVALKELRALHDDDPSYARRFLREARLAGSVSDPNVVTVYEHLEHDGTPYLAMEYLARGSLRPYVKGMNLAQVSGVLEGVLAGLVGAERHGIVHRDLKPENVMVTDDGRVKIADFGIAKATTQMGTGAFKTATGTTIGTPAYMAPEQAMARDIGPWTDLYSVGCMAFELFTGRVPFADVEEPLAILMRHVNEAIPPVKSVVPGVDDRISDWVERLLVKDPHRRTGSAAEAWEAFEEVTISLLGPRWRRDARLPERQADGETHATPVATGGPYTPPPPDLPPGPMAPPAADPDDQYVSFAPERGTPGVPTPADVEPPPPTATPADVEPPPPATLPGDVEPPPPATPAPRRPSARRRRLVAAAGALVVAAVAIVLATRGGGPGERAAAPAAAIPAANLTGNPSFERGVADWDTFQSKVTRERASDAPDGRYVARVSLATSPDEYSIDDEPDTVESSVAGRAYTASAWVKATPSTDGGRVCIAIREWRVARTDDSFEGVAQAAVTASAREFRKVQVRYVAMGNRNPIDIHVFRYPPGVSAGEDFLVDAITMTQRSGGGRNTQLVPRATCQSASG